MPALSASMRARLKGRILPAAARSARSLSESAARPTRWLIRCPVAPAPARTWRPKSTMKGSTSKATTSPPSGKVSAMFREATPQKAPTSRTRSAPDMAQSSRRSSQRSVPADHEASARIFVCPSVKSSSQFVASTLARRVATGWLACEATQSGGAAAEKPWKRSFGKVDRGWAPLVKFFLTGVPTRWLFGNADRMLWTRAIMRTCQGRSY
mmetsp:Transcript_129302/g.289118  ORF Transcript_129302/g.289118 Transcript_129302/m.289118 type:complete len:210 (+) Transcript_129302:315-944(+)